MSANQAHPLPQGWSRRRLRFDARTNPVKSELGLPDDTEVSFVPMDAVGEYGGLRLDQTRELADVYNGYTYFADGDVCIAKITPCFENGKGAMAEGLANGVAFGTTELHVLRPSQRLDQQFLFYLTIAHDFRGHGESEMLGAGGQKRVPESFLKDWMPLLPGIEVQQRIAHFLDEKTTRIDALIEKKRALLERLAEKRQALITRAVTQGLNPDAPMRPSGIDWLGEVPDHWRVKRLRFLMNGGTLNGLYKSKEQFATDGVAFVQMGEAFRSEIFDGDTRDRVLVSESEREKWGLQPGDFLIARRSLVFEGSGKSVMIGELEEDHVFESSMIRVRLVSPARLSGFIANYFRSSVCRAFVLSITKQVTISGIDSQQLKDVWVPMPPDHETEEISAACEAARHQLEAIAASISRSIATLVEHRTALITAAVTGQLPKLNG